MKTIILTDLAVAGGCGQRALSTTTSPVFCEPMDLGILQLGAALLTLFPRAHAPHFIHSASVIAGGSQPFLHQLKYLLRKYLSLQVPPQC